MQDDRSELEVNENQPNLISTGVKREKKPLVRRGLILLCVLGVLLCIPFPTVPIILATFIAGVFSLVSLVLGLWIGGNALLAFCLSFVLQSPLLATITVPLAAILLFAVVFIGLRRLSKMRTPMQAEFSKEGLLLSTPLGIKISIPWNDVLVLTAEKPEEHLAPDDCFLVAILKKNQRAYISMAGLANEALRTGLFQSLPQWAPHLVIDPSLKELWELEKRATYTEIWLHTLDQLPRRNRLGPLQPGDRLLSGVYNIESRIASGGQGTAYLAASKTLASEVVLKEFVLPILAERAERQRVLQNFETEVRVLKQLEHPQIVKLLDFFVEDFRSYLVLEHIAGKNLRELVRKEGALPEKKVWELAGQMHVILSHLHSQSPQVIHRDFTPDNLILNNEEQLKLIDFNVVHVGTESTTSQVVGKQSYLPPEQFRGQPVPASDIYALGCTLFFLLTGQDPMPLEESSPLLVGERFSLELDDLIHRCTKQNPGERPTLDQIGDCIKRRTAHDVASAQGGLALAGE